MASAINNREQVFLCHQSRTRIVRWRIQIRSDEIGCRQRELARASRQEEERWLLLVARLLLSSLVLVSLLLLLEAIRSQQQWLYSKSLSIPKSAGTGRPERQIGSLISTARDVNTSS